MKEILTRHLDFELDIMMKTYLILPVLLFVATLNATAQNDSILFLSGKVFKGTIGPVENGSLQITYDKKNGKPKTDFVEPYRVFSFVKEGKETVMYVQDEFKGDFLDVSQARAATYGSYDARFTFKPRLAFWSSLTIGFASTIFDTYLTEKEANDPGLLEPKTPGFFKTDPSVFSFLAPPIMLGVWAIPNTRVKYDKILHHSYHGDPDYYRGYNRIARQKRMFAALKGSVIGISAGLLTYLVVH